jgi:hypothetical protein
MGASSLRFFRFLLYRHGSEVNHSFASGSRLPVSPQLVVAHAGDAVADGIQSIDSRVKSYMSL